LIKNSLLDVT